MAARDPSSSPTVSATLPEVLTVASIAALKALDGGGTVEVLSYYANAIPDGGGGILTWNATDTRTDNGGTIVQPNSGGVGRWNRTETDTISVKKFGAVGDDITDDTAAITAANNSSFTLIYLPHGTYKTTLTTLSITKTYFGPGTIRLNGTLASPAGSWIKWNGATGGATTMPYLLSAYHLDNGRFVTGVDIIVSNKRVDVAGAIQGCNALANGTEPAMVDISPDVNGPALRLEGYSTLTGGQNNATALAIYDINAIIGGTTAYSAGYGTKKFAITGKGDLIWGSNLSNDPTNVVNALWTLRVLPSGGPTIIGGTGTSATLTLRSPTGQSSALVLDGPATGAFESIQWQKNSVGTWQIYQGSAASPNLFINGPSGKAILYEANNTIDIGDAAASGKPRTGYFGTSLLSPFIRVDNGASGAAVADSVQVYSSDNSAGHTIPSFYCEGTEVIATGQADSVSSVRVKMRINGTVVTLLAI